MRSIAIVGGGQAGLPLAVRLLDNDYRVTVVTNRTPENVRNGRVLSSQCMFDDALQIERDSGLNLWEKNCPNVDGIGFSVPHPEVAGEKAIEWSATLDKPAQAVDQRVKMPIWMELFESKGGKLVIEDVGIPELENLTATHDLVILAAGKGEVVRLFERDETRSAFSKPQRALALTYVNGMKKQDDFSQVAFNLIPGVGEYFTFPAFTTSGPCDIMVFEGIPGGPMDCWNDVTTPQEHLSKSKEILDTFAPWEAERCQHIELTDENGILAGRFPPTIRKPVMTLPSGRLVFGMGDAVATNDPITGQGSNNATKAAKVYGDAIIARGEQSFTADWMNQTFETFWDYASSVVNWTNSLLLPPPPHILELLASAQQIPSLASTIANGFNHPPNFYPWWEDANLCHSVIESHSAKRA
ncbi:putative oxygenase [Vibrio nigripulchritudo MADA3029]|uniref:styrene monooxygenase/indole monooxygenase family protein n=1 Tax=Vibrio nigripulchritudo TaxID=28173 RepID=UPI0003B23815|nr:styrene monooxygenase/indole monooxygenase family protein [Vibrio nigripulchritudo]CCN48884.1 putative oxygenase [Vibrio nigripulchritudo MADA3020]CCN51476.1 putative oxygenase [Vibrio nigripulchritudo MADA3021]CCN57658.1 putative oxygenase [Vibrio nigripulchritudo MADA3029]